MKSGGASRDSLQISRLFNAAIETFFTTTNQSGFELFFEPESVPLTKEKIAVRKSKLLSHQQILLTTSCCSNFSSCVCCRRVLVSGLSVPVVERVAKWWTSYHQCCSRAYAAAAAQSCFRARWSRPLGWAARTLLPPVVAEAAMGKLWLRWENTSWRSAVPRARSGESVLSVCGLRQHEVIFNY